MKKIFLFVLLILFMLPCIKAQKVGLVLSGGGAKGLTHIGIIRALEENNIPIDYIAGTSMGAIIGSLYAMGYSADDMATLIGSEEFTRWYTAKVEENYIYYFKRDRPTPEFFNIRLSMKDSLSTVTTQLLPASIINPIQMNLAFIELFSGATAACKGNFNNLFIPFRCIASDVYNKKEIILKDGDLGDAVRASMSFPFVFKPIEIDGVLAYDGGIYNNFPTDVMYNDFKPDIIIGSVVAKNPSKPDEKDIMNQLDNMIMQKTDYTMPDSLGILLTFRYDNVTLMDFHKLDELQQIGYDRTMSMMDSIKSRIHRRVDKENVQLRRMVYRSSYPELRFKNIYIDGANSQQQIYIKNEFERDESGLFGYESIKRAYFRLLSDNIISEIVPRAVYRPEENVFDLYLNVKIEDQFSIRMGGSVSTASSNQIYFGFTYQDLNFYSKEFTLDGQIGKIYSNAQFMAKVNFPTSIPTSYRLITSFSTFDYFKKDKIFSSNDKPAFNKKEEIFVKLMAALPFRYSKKAEFGFGVAQFKDSYFQGNVINFDEDRYDKSKYFILGGSISINGGTLNRRQYATQGYYEALVAQIYAGREEFRPGLKPKDQNRFKQNQSWLQISYTREDYHKISSKFILGSYIQALYASKNFSENYTATMLQAGDFSPTAHSKLTYNEAFRANQYAAAGIRPICLLNNLFHLRGEFYGFMPIFPIEKTSLNKAYYGKAFSRIEYMGEVSLICALPFGSIAAYVNHYSSPHKEWNVGLTLGWQLFNYRFFE